MKVIGDMLIDECGIYTSCNYSADLGVSVKDGFLHKNRYFNVKDGMLLKECLKCTKLESLNGFTNIKTKEDFLRIRDDVFMGMWALTSEEVTLIDEYDLFDNSDTEIKNFEGYYFVKLNCFIYLNNKEVNLIRDKNASGSYWSSPYSAAVKFNKSYFYKMYYSNDTIYIEDGIISRSTVKHKVTTNGYIGQVYTKPLLPGDYYVFVVRGRITGAVKNSSDEIFYILNLGS